MEKIWKTYGKLMKQMEQIGKIPEANGGDRNIIYDLGIFHRHT